MTNVYVSLEFTPNPNTLKYTVNVPLITKGTLNFTRAKEANEQSPLAKKLFEIHGISGVMIGKDFITITKSPEGDWELVHKGCSQTIEDHLKKGEPVVNALTVNAPSAASGATALEQKIIDILDKDIRPAVAMDGGDITFDRFEDGIVYLQMQGSCSGCPSSTMTLKMGIETRLREAIPEVREVVSV